MKGVFHRILLTIYILIIIAAAAYLAALTVGLADIKYTLNLLDRIGGDNILDKLFACGISAIMLIISLELLVAGYARQDAGSVLIKNTETGYITMTISSINEMAQKTARGVEGVREVRVSSQYKRGNVKLYVRMAVLQGKSIPEITQNVQTEIKSAMEMYAGIGISDIRIQVDNSLVASKIRD